MAEAHGRHDAHEEEEYAPPRTVPQGTQAYYVEQGYETRDINLRAILGWFIGLAIMAALIHLVLFGAFRGLMQFEASRDPQPGPFQAVQQVPPEPRLLPNPVDNPVRPRQPIPTPVDYRIQEQAAEERELERLGLIDPETRLPRIPEAAMEAVRTGRGAKILGSEAIGPMGDVQEMMPSEASGGTRKENRLQ